MTEYKGRILRKINTEVLICGGGVAGVAAAISSARSGAKTLLIDQYPVLGGNATMGLVGPFMTCFDIEEKRQVIKGIFDEIVREMEKRGGAIHPEKIGNGSPYASYGIRGHAHVTPFDPECLRSVIFDKLRESGVDLLLYTKAIDSITENNILKGVIAAENDGLAEIRANVTVDCTGNGDLFYWAGAQYDKGRVEDGLMQPLTLFLRVEDVDDKEVDNYVKAHPENYGKMFASIIKDTSEKGKCPLFRERIGIYKMLNPGEWRINTTRIFKKDGTNSQELTEGELEGHKQAQELMAYFKEYIPGFKKARLIQSATTIGVRETRRLRGVYTLTLEDLTEGRYFDDRIAVGAYPVDIHSPTGTDGGVLWKSTEIKPANQYYIPYSILIPEKLDGLIAAGRCVSATHEALGAIRVMPSSFAMGEAAGAAAALCTSINCKPRELPIKALQERLLFQNVVLD